MNSTPSNETASIDSPVSRADHSNAQPNTERAALLDDLLLATSRTFGLAIPMLPDELRQQVTVAYLLFRLADTIEDGQFATTEDKLAKFDAFASLVRGNGIDTVGHLTADELQAVKNQFGGLDVSNDEYLRLVDHLADVAAAAYEFAPNARDIILQSLNDSIRGMCAFVAVGDPSGNVQLTSLEEVREYCYAVAGVVGEMLTELFIENAPQLEPVAAQLRQRASVFGEGLQLVNILKDATDDQAEGRRFVPEGLPREQLFELARLDLTRATEYIGYLVDAAAPDAIIAFCDLPVRLAWRTLECVEADGPGSKVTREEVGKIVADVLANGRKPSSEG